MLALATGMAKRGYVSKLGSQNESKIEIKVIINQFPERSRQHGGTFENIRFYRLKHTSDASWTQPFSLKHASESCEKRSRKKTHERAQQNACRLDFRRQRSQSVAQKAPN